MKPKCVGHQPFGQFGAEWHNNQNMQIFNKNDRVSTMGIACHWDCSQVEILYHVTVPLNNYANCQSRHESVSKHAFNIHIVHEWMTFAEVDLL